MNIRRRKYAEWRRRRAIASIRLFLTECGYDVAYLSDDSVEAIMIELGEDLGTGFEALSVSAAMAAESLSHLTIAAREVDLRYGNLNASVLTDPFDDEFVAKKEWRP